jgi:integrase
MPKNGAGRLTALQIDALGPGLHSDGNNLYLRVKPDGRRSWVFIYRSPVTGKQREAGLGKASKGKDKVSLADARDQADEGRRLLKQKPPQDPLTAWRAPLPSSVMTFAEALEDYLEMNAPTWRSAKHAHQWRASLKAYARLLYGMPVDEIGAEHVLAVLRRVWVRIPETASRLRGRIEAIIDFGLPSDTGKLNPARWRGGLARKLSSPAKLGKIDKRTGERVERGNFAAMPYKNVPSFAALLRQEDGVAARALEFLLLCASRTGEALGARWSEIDRNARTWTIPPERLKTGKKTRQPHVVPLSGRALEILEEMDQIRSGPLIFPGRLCGKTLSHATMLDVLQERLGYRGLTIHGFRSSFRDWAGDETHFSRETCEMALAHIVGGVEGDYRRGDALRKRRELMDQWSTYCASAPPADAPAQTSATGNIMPFVARAS